MAGNKGTNVTDSDELDADQVRMKAIAVELEKKLVEGKFNEAFEGATLFHLEYPNSGPANIVYGLAALLTGRMDEADKAAQLLSKLPESDFLIILEYWANQLSAHQMMGPAYMVGLKILSLNVAEPRHFRSCAQVGLDNDDFVGLEQTLQGWSQRFPDDLGVSRYQARLLAHRGDLDGARKAAKKALKSTSDYGPALQSLADLDSSLIDDKEIRRARSMKKGAKDFEQAHICFALGKIFENRDENDEAFAEYSEANAALKNYFVQKNKHYDHQGMVTYYGYITKYTGGREDGDKSAQDRASDPMPRPIFIVGQPSSGTTLMEQILSMHGEVRALGERTVIGEMLATVVQKKRSGEWRNGIPEKDVQALREFYFEDVQQEIKGFAAITDKMPGNFAAIGLVKDIFPEARIIHMTRDPRDICVSIFTCFFTAGGYYSVDLENIGKNYALYRSIMNHWQRNYDSHILDVPYETLTEDLEPTVRNILDHCGLDYDASCLEFQQSKNPTLPMGAGLAMRTLHTTPIGHWKKFEKHLGPLIEALNSA